jgi:porin
MDEADSPGIAGNPSAVDVQPGTGALGRLLGLDPSTGFRLGGVLVSNGNYLLSGGNNPGRASFNNLLVIDLGVDLDKAAGIPGAKVGAALLRFDGQPTNQQAGVATGYNGLPGAPPLHRTELYELWWRQSFLTSWWCGSARRFRPMISATWSARLRCRTFRCRSRRRGVSSTRRYS